MAAPMVAGGAISLSLVYRIAHIATRCVAVLTMLFRVSSRIVTGRLRRARRATLLSHCSPLCCPASLRRALPQRFRPECRADATAREQLLGENDATICASCRDFNVQSELRPRQTRRSVAASSEKQVYTPIVIMHRAYEIIMPAI